jgi:glucose uptake protein GlcU
MICKKLAQSSVVEFMFTQAQKWGRIAATTLLLIVVFMSASANYHTRVSCIVLAFMGGCAFVVGQIMMLNDSTIVGANYLQPYSYGSLLTTIGLILLAWAITLRTP